MGNVVGIGGGRIVNPMATTVLTLTVDENHNVNLQCALPPDQAIKALQGVVTDILMSCITNAAALPKV